MALHLKANANDVVPANDDDDSGGFHARIEGVALWDLVQLECLAGTRKSVRVHSKGRVGHLHFEGGQLAHAVQGLMTGDAAALEILEWTRGEITPCPAPATSRLTVTMPWQSLLMQAAQRRDELRAASGSERPSAQRKSGVLILDPGVAQALREADQPDGRGSDGEDYGKAEIEWDGDMFEELQDDAFGGRACEQAVRVDAAGEVRACIGDEPEELAGQAAYTMRLGTLIGEILALGAISALELRRPGKRGPRSTFLYEEEEGELVAMRPADHEAAARLRRELGL